MVAQSRPFHGYGVLVETHWNDLAMNYAESFMGKEEADKLYADTREAVLAQGKTEAMADNIARVTVNCTRAKRGWNPGKVLKQYFAFARRSGE